MDGLLAMPEYRYTVQARTPMGWRSFGHSRERNWAISLMKRLFAIEYNNHRKWRIIRNEDHAHIREETYYELKNDEEIMAIRLRHT